MISKYQFPRDLSEEFKKIYFLAYETLNRNFGSMETSKDGKKNPGLLNTTDTVSDLKAIITLPMPEQFGDDLVHTWEKKDTLESLDAGASSATDAMIGVAALSSIFKSIQGIAAPLIGTLSLSKVVTGFLNAGKSPSVGLMSMFSGARKTLVNPDYWQNYTGSDPRTFEFKYVFQPRSREEATEVLNILRVFKMLSSPRLENVAESGSFGETIKNIFIGKASGEEKTIDAQDAGKEMSSFGEDLKKFLEDKQKNTLQGLSKVTKAEKGTKLEYIKILQGKCPEGYEMTYFKLGGKDGEGGRNAYMNVYFQILNLLNSRNIMGVYAATGNPNDDGYLSAPEWQREINTQRDPESFRYLYGLYVDNPGFYSQPRQIRFGVIFNF